jgi:hypothetical protein
MVALCFALGVSGTLHAQPSAESKAAAEALFDEGKKAMATGDYAVACQKFEQSDTLDPAIGTELNLGACYEKLGRTASAWATFRRAAAMAKAKKQPDREKLARKRAEELEANLARLTIVVPDAVRVPGLVVTRNGSEVSSELYGQPVPLDPGTLNIQAKAPGKQAFSTTVELAAKASQSVTIPELAADAAAVAPAVESEPQPPPVVTPANPPPADPYEPPPDSDAAASSGSGQRTLGLVIGGVGVVGLAVGGVFALRAQSKNDDSKNECSPNDENQCTARGVELRDEARSSGNVATIAGGLGLAALIGGTVLYFTAPSAKSGSEARARGPRVGVGFDAHGPSFLVRSSF